MKVLYMTTMYPVPACPQQGIFCHEQVKALKRNGVDVDVIVPLPFYSKCCSRPLWEYEGVQIRYIRYFKIPGTKRFEKIGAYLYDALRWSGIDFSKYDVIHADVPLPTGYAAMRLSKAYGKPYVIHCHGLDVFLHEDYGHCSNYPRISKCVDAVYHSAAAIVGVSQKTLSNVMERLQGADKCHVVYNGVDAERFIPESRISDGQTLKVVSVGNLIDIKGHDISIRAISCLVRDHGLKIQLDIYGRGNKEAELKALALELGLLESITFKGYVSYDRIAEELRKYDVFLLPSWYEAIGCVYLEAMASGILTVGCQDNGIAEIIEHGYNGFLARPRSVADVVEILRRISQALGTDAIRRIAENGRETVAKRFTWQHSANSLLAVYKEIV